MENIKGEIFQPFSPKIGKFKLSKDIIEDINSHIENIIKDEKLSKNLDYGGKLVGQVTQEIQLTEDVLSKGLIDQLSKFTQAYIFNSIQKEIRKFNLFESWVVRQFEGEYNPIHWHGGHISGVAYIKLPEIMKKNKFKNNFDKNGNIAFIYGSRQFLSHSIFTVKPEIGDIYLFPHYMMHTVYPFYGKGERRSLSFNAFIDEDIYSVYN